MTIAANPFLSTSQQLRVAHCQGICTIYMHFTVQVMEKLAMIQL